MRSSPCRCVILCNLLLNYIQCLNYLCHKKSILTKMFVQIVENLLKYSNKA